MTREYEDARSSIIAVINLPAMGPETPPHLGNLQAKRFPPTIIIILIIISIEIIIGIIIFSCKWLDALQEDSTWLELSQVKVEPRVASSPSSELQHWHSDYDDHDHHHHNHFHHLHNHRYSGQSSKKLFFWVKVARYRFSVSVLNFELKFMFSPFRG